MPRPRAGPPTILYLTVPEDTAVGPLAVTASLAGGATANYFGLFWGSIDNYNTLSFLYNGTTVASFTGLDIVIPADGNQTSAATNRYVNFFDLPVFNAVSLASTQYAFESDNHAYATVSVPNPERCCCSEAAWLDSRSGGAAKPERQANRSLKKPA